MKKLQLKKEVVERLNDDQRNSVNGGGWNTLGSMLESCYGWPCYPGDGPVIKPEVSHTCIKVSFYYSCDCKEYVKTALCVAE